MSSDTTNLLIKTIKLTDQSVKKYRSATIVDALLQALYNSIDADATNIKLSVYDNQGDLFSKNCKDTDCKQIVIEDNGCGIEFDLIDKIFLPLEDSWKKDKETTPLYHRPYHGHLGSGRFKYLALGENITWDTIYQKDGKYYKYKMSFNAKSPQKLNITDKIEIHPSSQCTGTKLTITMLTNKFENFLLKHAISFGLICSKLVTTIQHQATLREHLFCWY